MNSIYKSILGICQKLSGVFYYNVFLYVFLINEYCSLLKKYGKKYFGENLS